MMPFNVSGACASGYTNLRSVSFSWYFFIRFSMSSLSRLVLSFSMSIVTGTLRTHDCRLCGFCTALVVLALLGDERTVELILDRVKVSDRMGKSRLSIALDTVDDWRVEFILLL